MLDYISYLFYKCLRRCKVQQENQRNSNAKMWCQNFAECLQIQYDNSVIPA